MKNCLRRIRGNIFFSFQEKKIKSIRLLNSEVLLLLGYKNRADTKTNEKKRRKKKRKKDRKKELGWMWKRDEANKEWGNWMDNIKSIISIKEIEYLWRYLRAVEKKKIKEMDTYFVFFTRLNRMWESRR